ncbi:MAG TPA: TetR/AcrR family transcriptional regulator [Dongiaceae bacterium]|nr:TetR/AcrR family transcriptional regulator [Dongiaceae bacterium]
MRYKPEYKAEARAKLLETAGTLAKEKGFGTTGVDVFMAAAGLTSGAFYTHFDSKSEFLKAILETELVRTQTMFSSKDRASLLKMAKAYLSEAHVAHPGKGCPLPALSAEVARSDADTRQSYENLIVQLKDQLVEQLDDDSAAWALLSQAVGAVLIARAMNTEQARKGLLRAAIQQVEEILKQE